MFKLEEDALPCSLQAPLPVPGTVTRTRGVAHTIEKSEVHRFLFFGHYANRWWGSKTHDQPAAFLVDFLLQGRLAGR